VYPSGRGSNIPPALLDTFEDAHRRVVDVIGFRRYPELGNKSYSEVIRFRPKEQEMIEEAARRLAAGTDPGVIPARFLIGATRVALDRGLARPQAITDSFYQELTRR